MNIESVTIAGASIGFSERLIPCAMFYYTFTRDWRSAHPLPRAFLLRPFFCSERSQALLARHQEQDTADMLNALTNVRFWEQTGHLTNRCLLISIYEYTA